MSKLVVYLTFDGIERVETAKEWKEGCTAYYGEVEGKEEKEAKSQRKEIRPSARCTWDAHCDISFAAVRGTSLPGTDHLHNVCQRKSSPQEVP